MATHLIPVIGKALFSAPPPSATSSSAPSSSSAAQENVAANQENLERQRRLEELRRRRRGLSGTIATSPRGFLAPTDSTPKRISLLGE